MRPVPELSGQVFGRWTVLKDYILTPRGERNGLAVVSAAQSVMFWNGR